LSIVVDRCRSLPIVDLMTNLICPRRRFDPGITEMIDRPQPISEPLRKDLENLKRLNRFFGSYALIRYFLKRWFNAEQPIVILDLCTGSADIPRLIVDWCRARKIHVRITAVDFQTSTLELARAQSRAYPEITFVEQDVFRYEPMFPVDFVFCSLALHHFSNAQASLLLGRIRGFTRRGVLVTDIARSDFGVIGIYLLTAILFREPMTRFDARLSLHRAFSFREMREIAEAAGWRNFGHRRFPISRQAIWLE
jgi:SAM-dependent methyltransferase